ncbi:penicillin acylase family protein [Pyxidicoccus fallax]|uniref:Penicillin acylase family protein n=1 Tax=Pyxidicoccus fallax TaxID=394095 RepID=A0A848L5E1_9BACT|nr:penicillin acylase family protein [Pyxidicoccus fallax]NMO13492.1 penicillin acylase family protein [Pyxidicoccus fallax]NPC76706.1 penicillin acylase family protein [Pyxidicoccus fallax]
MSAFNRWYQMLRRLPPALATMTPGLGPWMARRRWPRAQGTLQLQGLHGPVEVLRDTWGVPHIFARDEHDLFFAQGYVQAQDRLWQIEFGRLVGNGLLASVLGPRLVPMDHLMRTLGLRRMAEQGLSSVSPQAMDILEAYSAGVNARIANEPLPLEFTILGHSPAPWKPVDTLLRGNLLAMMLGGNYRLELLRARLVAEAGEDVAALLLPSHAPQTPLIVPKEARLQGLRGVKSLEGLDATDAVLGDPNIVSGSNNWVVHGQRTASGKPLLANDVHIGLGMPAQFYETGLHGGRFDHVGFSLPGVPMLVIGHNGHASWGMSNLGPDTQDFYLEKLDDPKQPTRYEYQGAWHDLEIRREQFPVRGGPPAMTTIRSTRHGPLLNRAMSQLMADEAPLALRWAHTDCKPLVDALLGLNLAKSWDEFRAACALWESPGQNFVYADVKGNVGYQSTGKIPLRAAGHQGTVPVPGWTGEYEWQGYIPFEDLPASLNPPAGYAATANNKITSDDYPYVIAHNWFPGYRAKRITDLLAEGTKHTVEDMRRIQSETYSIPAELMRPHLLAVKPADDAQAQALKALAEWDLRFEVDSVGATIFQAWYIHVLRALLRHKLQPKLAQRYLESDYERHGSMHMPLVIELMGKPDDAWWDDPATPERETRDDILRRTLGEALRWLGEHHGQDPKGWAWGNVHTVTYQHMTLGGPASPGPLRRLANTRTLPARGDNYSVDGASFLWHQPFKVVHGTALRMIVDLGDLSKSVAIHAPGQSEHLYHPHRDDLLELNSQVRYHPLLHTRQAVEAHVRNTLTLQPAGKPKT